MGNNSIDIYGDMPKAIAGAKYGLHDETETFIAGEKIYPGDPCFGMVGEGSKCYGAHVSAASLTASVNLVTGNKIAVTINGVALPVIDFINSHQETMQAIVQSINLNEGISALGINAFLVEGAPRSFYLESPGLSITASAVVTDGATQANFVSASYSSAKFLGVARHQELSYVEGTGFYPEGQPVSVMSYGKIWVPVAEDASPVDKEPAYVILSGDNAGKFTDDSGSGNYNCGCIFRSKNEGGLALIEVRGLK
jgi:hypothetical protein